MNKSQNLTGNGVDLTRKPKIAMIVGYFEHPRFLDGFYRLANHADLFWYKFNELNYDMDSDNSKVISFQSITETPGYMKKLEEHLFEMDAIICFGQESMYSFRIS